MAQFSERNKYFHLKYHITRTINMRVYTNNHIIKKNCIRLEIVLKKTLMITDTMKLRTL